MGGTDVFRPGAQGCMEPARVHRSWDVHHRDQRLRRASGRFSGAGLEGFSREIARGGYAGAKCCSASRGRGTWITRCCAGGSPSTAPKRPTARLFGGGRHDDLDTLAGQGATCRNLPARSDTRGALCPAAPAGSGPLRRKSAEQTVAPGPCRMGKTPCISRGQARHWTENLRNHAGGSAPPGQRRTTHAQPAAI